MLVIDSDTHVIETEHTWDFMLPSDSAYRPEVVKGDDLAIHLARKRRFPPEEAAAIVRDAARALQHAHDNNVVFLDPRLLQKPTSACQNHSNQL